MKGLQPHAAAANVLQQDGAMHHNDDAQQPCSRRSWMPVAWQAGDRMLPTSSVRCIEIEHQPDHNGCQLSANIRRAAAQKAPEPLKLWNPKTLPAGARRRRCAASRRHRSSAAAGCAGCWSSLWVSAGYSDRRRQRLKWRMLWIRSRKASNVGRVHAVIPHELKSQECVFHPHHVCHARVAAQKGRHP